MKLTYPNGHANGRAAPVGPDALPPYNLEAERSVLGSCILDGAMIDEVAAVGIRADDFMRAVHGEAWDALVEVQRRGDRVDAVTLADYLIARGRFDGLGGDEFLRSLADSVPHAANARYYAGIVREKAVGRRIIEACTALIRECQAQQMTASDLLCEAQERMLALSDRDGGDEPVPYAALMDETMTRMGVREETGELGLSSGFPDIDEITKGFRPGDLTIVAGRPSSGKTSLALAFARAIGALGVHVLVFSIEMGREALGDRIVTAEARVDNYRFDRAWSLRADERDRLTRSAVDLMRIPVAVDFSPARSIAQIGAVSRRHQRRHGLGAVMVDYAQIVKGVRHRNGSRQEEVAGISAGLKELARSLSVPVVALAQLNREVEKRPDKTPTMSDLKESGQLEQDADVVMLTFRPETYDAGDRPGIAEVIIDKNRNGRTGTVRLAYLKHCTRFESLARVAEPAGGLCDDTSF